MKFSEQSYAAAQSKIEELVSDKAGIASDDMNAALNKIANQASNVGYSSYGDDASYKLNAPPVRFNAPPVDHLIGGYVQHQDNWGGITSDNTSIGTGWSQQFARLTEDPAKHKEDQMLKQMPLDMTLERMKRCAKCTYANAFHCMHRFKNGQSDSPCPCDQRNMLVYGHCPKFMSAEQVEIELAAEGIDDGKE